VKLSEIELPSNRKFGFFFTAVFLIASAYFYYASTYFLFYLLTFFGVAFLFTTLINAELLLPLNKLWMNLGILLGKIINPIIMGLIFFLIFTPFALLMRLFGRDELRLHFDKQNSYWISRETDAQSGTFKNQF